MYVQIIPTKIYTVIAIYYYLIENVFNRNLTFGDFYNPTQLRSVRFRHLRSYM